MHGKESRTFLDCVLIGNIFVIKPSQLFEKAKSPFYPSDSSDSSCNPVTFWRTFKSPSQHRASALPVRIIKGSINISDKRKLCSIFNEHFVNAGHLFENVGLLPAVSSYDSRPDVPVLQNSCTFSEGEVLEALCGTDSKQSTGLIN